LKVTAMESLSVTVMPKEQIREPPATALGWPTVRKRV